MPFAGIWQPSMYLKLTSLRKRLSVKVPLGRVCWKAVPLVLGDC